jgi:hypothetical protein
MKNQNLVFIAIAFALAFALAPVTQARPHPLSGLNHPPPNDGADSTYSISSESSEDKDLPMVSIHSAGNVVRGKTGSFVLDMKPAYMFYAVYANFSVSGTAVAGVDYVALISPAYIGESGYATILVKTLPDPRKSFPAQAYSVVVTLEPGEGYALGNATGGATSATIWIKPDALAVW